MSNRWKSRGVNRRTDRRTGEFLYTAIQLKKDEPDDISVTVKLNEDSLDESELERLGRQALMESIAGFNILYGIQWEDGGIAFTSGVSNDEQLGVRRKIDEFIPVQGIDGLEIEVSGDYQVALFFYRENESFINSQYWLTSGEVQGVPSDTALIKVSASKVNFSEFEDGEYPDVALYANGGVTRPVNWLPNDSESWIPGQLGGNTGNHQPEGVPYIVLSTVNSFPVPPGTYEFRYNTNHSIEVGWASWDRDGKFIHRPTWYGWGRTVTIHEDAHLTRFMIVHRDHSEDDPVDVSVIEDLDLRFFRTDGGGRPIIEPLLDRRNEIERHYIDNQGNIITTQAEWADYVATSPNLIPVQEGDRIILRKVGATSGNENAWRFKWLDEDENFVSRNSTFNNEMIFTASIDGYLQVSYPMHREPMVYRETS